MEMEREFNIFGPINPKAHYHVDRIVTKAELRQKIAKGRYFTLNASRQTGKTTLFHEMIAELEETGEYFCILLNFEELVNHEKANFYGELSLMLAKWREIFAPDAPEPDSFRQHGDFGRWLRQTSRQLKKKCVLIIDKFDTVPVKLTTPILSIFRGLYQRRSVKNECSPHSILFVGLRIMPAHLSDTYPPFNIADQFTVPYFTEDEVKALLTQHTEATGQIFEEDVLQSIYAQTEGQPFLINRLGQMLTTKTDIDISQPITHKHLEYALIRLVNENNTPFSSIRSNAALHRAEVLDALFSSRRYYNFQDEAIQELLMYGVLRTLQDDYGVEYARIANPIYQKMLIKTFAPTNSLLSQAINGSVYHRHLV